MRSIRSQLTRQLVLGTLVIASCGGTAAYLAIRTEMLRQFDGALLAKARAVCALSRQENGKPPKLESEDLRALDFAASGSGHYFQVWRADGKSIARSPEDSTAALAPAPGGGTTPDFRNLTLPGNVPGRRVEFTYTPSVEDNDDDDDDRKRRAPFTATIVFASSRQSVDATLGTMLAALGLSTGLLLAGAWLLVPRVLGRGLRPLDELGDQVTRIDADSLDTRFSETGAPAEIAPIARRLNDLLARLGGSFERERRFSADLAHELRTPLAELRSQAELALRWPDARAATADSDTLEITLRMEHLVTRLLALARAEAGQPGIAKSPVDIGAAVMAAWHPFSETAAARDLRVTFRLPSGLAVETEPALFREILANLFSNAADHAPHGGEVEIAAEPAPDGFKLLVTNAARSLDARDVEKIFDRFWRKDAARTDDAHAGLGLALARGYAHALGWELRASLEDSRLTFTLDGGEM